MAQPNTIGDVETRQLTCPKCGSAMETLALAGQSADRCGRCKGLFFSFESHEQLLQTPGAEAIDTGAKSEEPRDQVVRINCPSCHAQMIRMVDRRQPHIWYESCPVCYGVYFDAGEFREQKRPRIINVIADFFHHQQRP